ncbi:MAG TPA: glucose 1-dehydrogenase [Pseudolabrys sp.]|jgi:threonine dehydrogenase-like Zn-dependent dehydrogenase|nr:glucose 1-dehydrogenase [Pseudolabrys sp.]
MRALTVLPGKPNSIRLEEVPPPLASDGPVLVRALALGVCGTDREIVAGLYGEPPPGQQRLIIGHESLGEVQEAPDGCGFAPGDLVVGIVRRPDPVPCPACAVGEWDMCRNGRYTERGIKQRNGYGSERFRVEPDFLVRIDRGLGPLGVLMEPTSIVAKAWEHVERIGARSRAWKPRVALVTGAGPVGLLAALLGHQRGLELHILDRADEGLKPQLARDLGATYHTGDLGTLAPDVVIECTGAASVVLDVMSRTAPDGIVCLAGVSSGGHSLKFDVGKLNREMVLENDVVFGSVNANRRHYQDAADALAKADKNWLSRLVTRRVPLDRWREAFERRDNDVKTVIDFSQ